MCRTAALESPHAVRLASVNRTCVDNPIARREKSIQLFALKEITLRQ
jgi:hypothetical protein